MYAHQVIEDLEKSYNYIVASSQNIIKSKEGRERISCDKTIAQEFCRALTLSCNLKQITGPLKQAHKFHIGKQTNKNCPVALPEGHKAFLEPPTSEVRPPYRLFYMDWPVDYSDGGDRYVYGTKELAESSSKRAILCEEIEDNLIFVVVFNYFDSLKKWDISPAAMLCTVGYPLCEVTEKTYNKITATLKQYDYFSMPPALDILRKADKSLGSLLVSLASPMPNDMLEHYAGENMDEVKTLAAVFTILSCKNITTETINPDEKLNKSRIKKGKLPIYSYKTLVIKPVGKKQESIPKHLWNNRIHLARGHFKEYTAEKPLFGRITGRFWWQPHVRGRNHGGVVMKDYKVETKGVCLNA